MNKTKLGISAGLMAAILWLLGLYGGYVIVGVAVGYILLAEDNSWLKKQALRTVGLMLLFSLLSTVLNLVPNILSLVYEVANLFNKYPNFSKVHQVFSVLSSVLSVVKTWLFVLLGVMILFGKNFKVPVLDSLIDKLV